MDLRQMISIFAIFALIILMGQYARAEPSITDNHSKFRSLNFNPNLQNLIMGPNELDDSNDKGLKPKSVVIGGGGLLGRVHWSSLFDLK